MKLKIIILQNINFYYFIDNLADYHPFSRIWAFKNIKDKLNLSQQDNLKKYKKIRKKYEEKSWYEDSFVSENLENSFSMLSGKILPEELIIVKQTFQSFQELFNSLWKKNEHVLISNKKNLEEYWTLIEKNIFNELKRVLNIRNAKEIQLFLCFSPKGSGGSVFGNKGILLEISPNYNVKQLICILIHEIVHYLDLQNKNSFKQFIKAGIPEEKAKIIHEAVVELFAPDGYLTKKYVKYKFKKNETKWSKEVDKTKKIIEPIFNKYLISENKNYWNDFIPKIIEKFL